MKITRLKLNTLAAALAVFALTSCKEEGNRQDAKLNSSEEVANEASKTPDRADQDFKDGMTGKVWHNYLQLKMALAASDTEGASNAAGNMAEGLGAERKDLQSLAEELAAATDLEKQRQIFASLSEGAGPLFKDALAAGTIYKKYCPMAFDNKGAFWYSDVTEIQNPYFGDKMLRCGSVKETITR